MLFSPCEALIQTNQDVCANLEARLVQIWGVALDGSPHCLETCYRWLDKQERSRASRFIREDDQRQHILAHGILRFVLSRYLDCDPGEICFSASQGGKPILRSQSLSSSPLLFNMSHSHARTLISVAKQMEVGVDVERVREGIDAKSLAARYFSRAESARFPGKQLNDETVEFFRYWVAKEAMLKGQGVGLPSLQQCEILPILDGSSAEVHLFEGTTLEPGWTVRWLDCGPGWAGAVSAQGTDWSIRMMTG